MDENERGRKKKSGADWSKMCVDVMQSILERLSFPVFLRARSVCPSWYSISKSCNYRYPWLIIFPEKYSGEETCTLYDPREDKTYKSQNLGIELSESSCIASYGNWILMLNHKFDFWILNVFSGDRIDIPRVKLRGKVKFRRPRNGGFVLEHSRDDREAIFHLYIKTGMLWIDEETKDFVVGWIYNDHHMFLYKKGDDSWWYFQGTGCLSMAYNHHDQKLYVYTWLDFIKIFDISGDSPKVLVEEENPYFRHCFWIVPQPWDRIRKRRIAITKSGDVMIVLSLKGFPANREERMFFVFKMNRQGTKWERVYSLGNEMLVYGDGLTLAASGEERGLIYLVADDLWRPQLDSFPQHSAGVFRLQTAESGWYRFPYCSTNDRWFVPGYDRN